MWRLISLFCAVCLLGYGVIASAATGSGAASLPAKIRIGVAANAPPFVSKPPGQSLSGFDIDLMEAVAKQGGLGIEWVEVPFQDLFKRLAGGQFEMAIGALTISNAGLRSAVSFTDPYLRTGQSIIVIKDSAIQGPADLGGKKVGFEAGSTGAEWLAQQPNLNSISFNDVARMYQALRNRSVDAVVHDEIVASRFIRNNPYLGLIPLAPTVTTEQYGIAVRKDLPQLLAQINQALAVVARSPAYQEQCRKLLMREAACLEPNAPAPITVAPPTSVTEPAKPSTPAASKPVGSELIAVLAEPETPSSTSGSYVIQSGDVLSVIAHQYLGNAPAYRAIVQYTNERCRAAASPFTCINNPNRIKPGTTVYLPSAPELNAYWQTKLFGSLGACTPAQASGDIAINGSSTVYLLTKHIADDFQNRGFRGKVSITNSESGQGFKAFCDQLQVDVVNASRPIKADEIRRCQQQRRDPLELQIGTDAIVVAISRQNNFVNDVTQAELKRIFSTATTWAEVRKEWPAAPIKRLVHTPESGTFEVFVRLVLNNDAKSLLAAKNLTQYPDDEKLVTGVATDPLAISFFGYAYYKNHRDTLRAVAIDGVPPRQETVDDGSYPLLRPLFLYTSGSLLKQKPQLSAFLICYLRTVKDVIAQVGYFLPREAEFQETIRRFVKAGGP